MLWGSRDAEGNPSWEAGFTLEMSQQRKQQRRCCLCVAWRMTSSASGEMQTSALIYIHGNFPADSGLMKATTRPSALGNITYVKCVKCKHLTRGRNDRNKPEGSDVRGKKRGGTSVLIRGRRRGWTVEQQKEKEDAVETRVRRVIWLMNSSYLAALPDDEHRHMWSEWQIRLIDRLLSSGERLLSTSLAEKLITDEIKC